METCTQIRKIHLLYLGLLSYHRQMSLCLIQSKDQIRSYTFHLKPLVDIHCKQYVGRLQLKFFLLFQMLCRLFHLHSLIQDIQGIFHFFGQLLQSFKVGCDEQNLTNLQNNTCCAPVKILCASSTIQGFQDTSSLQPPAMI